MIKDFLYFLVELLPNHRRSPFGLTTLTINQVFIERLKKTYMKCRVNLQSIWYSLYAFHSLKRSIIFRRQPSMYNFAIDFLPYLSVNLSNTLSPTLNSSGLLPASIYFFNHQDALAKLSNACVATVTSLVRTYTLLDTSFR